jgi:hypothetical protein
MPKSILANAPLFSNADMSIGQTSNLIKIYQLDNVSICLSLSSTAVGTFYVDGGDGTIMLPLSFGTQITAPDPDNEIHIELTELGCSHLRVRYVPTSGTGALSGTIEGKSLS